MISSALRDTVLYLSLSLGFFPDNVSARYLRDGSANDLICASVDTDVTRILGR